MNRILIGLCALGLLACSSETPAQPPPDAGTDAGSDAGPSWSEVVIDPSADAGYDLVAAVDPQGHPAVAYFRRDGPAKYAIVVARETSPGAWSQETLNASADGGVYLTGHYGLGLAFDPGGNPAVTYMGGTTSQSKGDGRWTDFTDSSGLLLPSDSILARKAGSTWTQTTLGTHSNSFITSNCSPAPCVDDQGVVIGLWSAVGFSADGTAHVVQRDVHYGSDDTAGKDSNLEYGAFNSSGAMVRGEMVAANRGADSSKFLSGAGTYTGLRMVNDAPVIAFALSPVSTSDSVGVVFATRASGAWVHTTVSAAPSRPGHGPSLAWSAARGFAIAYFDGPSGDGRLATSTDGVDWSHDDPIEVLGETGLHPAAAFAGARLGVLWAFCRSPIDPVGACNPDVNELRFRLVASDGTQGDVEAISKLVPSQTALVGDGSGAFVAVFQTAGKGLVAARRTP